MPAAEADRKSHRKRMPFVAFVIPLFIGLLGFYSVTLSPQFGSYRTVHVIQLVGSGACFGAALVGLMVKLLQPRIC